MHSRFVPESYLARFTDEEGFLHIFDRSLRSFRRQRPKKVMKINSYYGQDWVPAERLEWEVFEAERGAAFVTTDSPVSLYKPKTLSPAEAGLALAGTMGFFALSSRHALVMRHPEVRTDPGIVSLAVLPEPLDDDRQISLVHGAVWRHHEVDSFNWKMAQLSDQLIIAKNKDVLQACATKI